MAQPINYSATRHPPKVTLTCTSPSQTKQSDKDSCDINLIVKRYQTSGILPPVNVQGLFVDVSSMPDYRAAIDQVEFAAGIFRQLTTEQREFFQNDVEAFLDFVSDANNTEAMKDLGLIPASPEQQQQQEQPQPSATA